MYLFIYVYIKEGSQLFGSYPLRYVLYLSAAFPLSPGPGKCGSKFACKQQLETHHFPLFPCNLYFEACCFQSNSATEFSERKAVDRPFPSGIYPNSCKATIIFHGNEIYKLSGHCVKCFIFLF